MFTLHEPPLFTRLRMAERILVAGAGGGFDVYAGLPLAFALTAMGKDVHLANFSFTDLRTCDTWLESTDTMTEVALTIEQHRYGVDRRLWRAFPH
ncbi:hypothetical protein [Actinocrispum wychmicini]|uniref:DUF1152 domain-containing protein n=1 Tax=Actinocrispum wychmicini TaxID=1213861 RepID=A0A4R2IUI5_9PSEU|nr:hypothetical protein [Actinocrispum wychmicini]TCO48106.1 hypothetical protein EV192_116159 [Actinocrispum wychmicini]